jgi:hypothetical protein
MTTPKGLALHYDVLRPAERLALMVNAQARGDGRERDRLAWAAPMLRYGIPHYYPHAFSWLFVAFLHYSKVMDAAGLLARVEGLANLPGVSEAKADHLVKLCAYLLVIELDGWDQLAKEHRFESRALWQGLPAAGRLLDIEAIARAEAYTAEEAARHLNDHDSGAVLRTTATVTRELRGLFDDLLGRWELPPD